MVATVAMVDTKWHTNRSVYYQEGSEAEEGDSSDMEEEEDTEEGEEDSEDEEEEEEEEMCLPGMDGKEEVSSVF